MKTKLLQTLQSSRQINFKSHKVALLAYFYYKQSSCLNIKKKVLNQLMCSSINQNLPVPTFYLVHILVRTYQTGYANKERLV